jgi:hypothetical protein
LNPLPPGLLGSFARKSGIIFTLFEKTFSSYRT